VPPAKLAPLAELYRGTGVKAGHDARELKISLASHMHIAEDSQDARDTFYPHYAAYFRTHVPTNFRARDISRADFEALVAADGPTFVGSPQQIVDKVMYERELFGHQRFLAQIDIGGLPFAKVARVIESFATKVAPAVRGKAGS
jgi:alkanesulfonate monooxygenase SsuD/methylene tetrahydromethanopterin reductase-like flavin-dependent oxidoreductase (luciferase family)